MQHYTFHWIYFLKYTKLYVYTWLVLDPPVRDHDWIKEQHVLLLINTPLEHDFSSRSRRHWSIAMTSSHPQECPLDDVIAPPHPYRRIWKYIFFYFWMKGLKKKQIGFRNFNDLAITVEVSLNIRCRKRNPPIIQQIIGNRLDLRESSLHFDTHVMHYDYGVYK